MKNKTFVALSILSLACAAPMITSCASNMHQESTGQYVDSSAITAKVKTKLLADKKVKSLPITVNTYNNVVQLSGFVDTPYQKARAVMIAKQVAGVVEVRDDLVIRSST